MFQSEQIPLEEWFSLAKSFDIKQTLGSFLSKVRISDMNLEPSRKSLVKLFHNNN